MKSYHIISKNGCKRVEYMLQSLNKLMIREEVRRINKMYFGKDLTMVQVRIKETRKQS